MITSNQVPVDMELPRGWDTNGESHFIPKVWIEDKSCGLEADVPCNIHKAGLGNDLWS